MAVSSVHDSSVYQIIQSNQNRLRIDDQIKGNTDNVSDALTKTESGANTPVEVVPKVSSENYNEAYSHAQQELDSSNSSSQISAYKNVQNLEKRDSLSGMLGISVYA